MASSLTEYLKQNPKKHLIFDFDGTIFRLDWAHGKVPEYRKKLWKAFRTIDPVLLTKYPEPVPGVFEQISNEAIRNYEEKAKEILFPLFEAKEHSLIDNGQPIAEIIQFIENQNSNYKFHIWSSNINSTFKIVLEKYNLLQYFGILVGRNQVDQAKPDPEGFELIYDGTSPRSDYLMIGDADRDKYGAENAGIDFFSFNSEI